MADLVAERDAIEARPIADFHRVEGIEDLVAELESVQDTADDAGGDAPASSPASKVRSTRAAPRASSWTGRRLAAVLRRDVLAAAVVIAIPFFWVVDATYRASLAALGRDQGIFQYVAWAIERGMRDYRDVRDINGPLIHLVHFVFLKLGGADEHRFRVLDLTVTGITFALAGACLPGLSRDEPARAPTPSWLARVAWGAAAWVALSAQYHLFTPWNQAQRESICDWFLLPSVGLLLLGRRTTARAETTRFALAGALSVIAWFGKPTFVVFTAAQLVALAVTAPSWASAKRAARTFAAGGLAGALVPLTFLVTKGDLVAFVRASLTDVPKVYRFIWARTAREILGDDGTLPTAAMGLAAAALLTSLVVAKLAPRRMLVLAVMPVAAIASAVLQHKGFSYHFHPLLAFTSMAWLAAVVVLWERYRDASRARTWGKLLALGAATLLALETAQSLRLSPHMRDVWILAGGATPERRLREDYLNHYRTIDFFPFEMRQAASYLQQVVPEEGRVQTFGMDPYLLFLAQRSSATPFVYAFDLDPSAALEGGFQNVPDEATSSYIHGARFRNEHAMLDALVARPPEAFVFMDQAPMMDLKDAELDFAKWCPETTEWLLPRYHRAATFGPYRVWLRNDLAAR